MQFSLPTVYYHILSAAISDMFPVSCASFSSIHRSPRSSSCRRSEPLKTMYTPAHMPLRRADRNPGGIHHAFPTPTADLPVRHDAWDDDRASEKYMRARIAVRIAREPRLLYPKTRPTLFLTTPVRICPPSPPMPMFQPEDARLLAHFCLASRSLQNARTLTARQSVNLRRTMVR